MSHRLPCAAALTVVFGLIGSAEPPRSDPARSAADAYQSTLVKLDEDYQKGLEPLKAEYVKALTEARKVALDKNDLDESQRVADAIKSADELVAPVQVTAMRHRLGGTVWEWHNNPNEKLTLNANGTISASWSPESKGFWHVNPDLTVVWYTNTNPWSWHMRFNANLTAYEASVPTQNLNKQEWSGKRTK